MSKLYFGGVPTDIEIKTLMDHFVRDSLQEGMVISHKDISKLISVSDESNRFRTVTTRWRKIVEKEYGIIVGPDRGNPRHFKVYSDSEKLGLSESKLRSAVKSSRRVITVSSTINTSKLSDVELEKHDFVVKRSASILATAQIKSVNKKPLLTD